MEREIKFKVWRKEEKRMIDPDIVKDWPTEALVSDNFHRILQYTGVSDSNGIEVYEGDIVRSPQQGDSEGSIYTVSWDLEKGAWRLKMKDKEAVFSLVKDYEIIGNIYENPELI
jgi:uncharacterized phage protein (TIGR01671 family)